MMTHPSGYARSERARRIRRWARRELDRLSHPDYCVCLECFAEVQEWWDAFYCNGRHHPGKPHDLWGMCTAMSLGWPERDYAGRELQRAGWWA